MRVLAHVHTLNDAAVIGQLLEGLRRQTRPPDAIIIVDNGSTDATLERAFPDGGTVVRNSENLGTSGAIRIGLAYALENEFDCTWVLDADSVPEPDALESLIAFLERLSPLEREKVCFLGCALINAEGEVRHEPMIFSNSAVTPVPIEPDATHAQCDYFIWTGSLFRMPAVAQIGLPSADYVLDAGEIEYGYRARQLGLTSYVVQSAITHQDVGRSPGVVVSRIWNIGRWKFAFYEISPIRAYYASRNLLYFWLYQFRPLRARQGIRIIPRLLRLPASFALRPISHRPQLIASLRGLWDGLTAHMERRY